MSTTDAPAFRRYRRAIRAIRDVENYLYYVNCVRRITPHIIDNNDPPALTRANQGDRLLHPTFCHKGIMHKLVRDPFKRAKQFRVVTWNGENAVIEVRAKANRTVADAARIASAGATRFTATRQRRSRLSIAHITSTTKSHVRLLCLCQPRPQRMSLSRLC